LPGRWWRPLEGEAPKGLRGWASVALSYVMGGA